MRILKNCSIIRANSEVHLSVIIRNTRQQIIVRLCESYICRRRITRSPIKRNVRWQFQIVIDCHFRGLDISKTWTVPKQTQLNPHTWEFLSTKAHSRSNAFFVFRHRANRTKLHRSSTSMPLITLVEFSWSCKRDLNPSRDTDCKDEKLRILSRYIKINKRLFWYLLHKVS